MVSKISQSKQEDCEKPAEGLQISQQHGLEQSLDSISQRSENDNPEASQEEDKNPKLVIILSGKRKSGKDHISTYLTDYIGREHQHQLAILRIAGPIKKEFATNNGAEFSRLLDSSSYKENYRLAMVDWSEKYRATKGWNCFLEQAIEEQAGNRKPIWVLNDARRQCDVDFFDNNTKLSSGKTKIIKVRIEASKETRVARGWTFVEGIDDKPTECGLDNYSDWGLIIRNDGDQSLEQSLAPILSEIDETLKKNSN